MPITVRLPDLESQTAFNVARWTEILDDPRLAKMPERIETDRHGHIIMSPPPASRHSRRQARIAAVFAQLLPEGIAFTECAISTADGVKAADVAWLAHERPEIHQDPILFTRAPEICVEILSPTNTASEIDEKRALYFDAGASEVWICNLDGSITFFVSLDHLQSTSTLCPAFPRAIL
jgi:Uma2 family endonuclease